MTQAYHAHIEMLAKDNSDFRRVLFTANDLQLVLMSLLPGEEIGLETHHDNDQFFRFETGEGTVQAGEDMFEVSDGDAVVVPKGTAHNVSNRSQTESLRFYTIYTPPHHPGGTVHRTKEEAMEAEIVERAEG